MALTAKAMPYKKGFGPFASDVYRVPTSYPFRDPEGMTGEQAAARAIAMAEKQVGADQIAALVIEPIQGEGGFVVPAPGFLPALQKWCNDNGIVLVADEVQTGFARTGAWFACEHEGVVPDLVTVAKGIAGGLPLSARHRPGRADGRRAPRRPRRHLRRQPGRLRRGPRRHRDDARGGPHRRRAADRGAWPRTACRSSPTRCPPSATSAGAAAMLAIELVKPGTTEPDAELTAAGGQGLPRAGRARPDLRHLRQRASGCCRRWSSATSCCWRACRCSRTRCCPSPPERRRAPHHEARPSPRDGRASCVPDAGQAGTTVTSPRPRPRTPSAKRAASPTTTTVQSPVTKRLYAAREPLSVHRAPGRAGWPW